jgi:hypothetical protein
VADIEGGVLALVVIRLVVARLADVGAAGGQLGADVFGGSFSPSRRM